MEELVPLFMKIGLTEQKAKETLKNKNLSKSLGLVVDEAAGQAAELDKVGNLLYHVASKMKPQVFQYMPLLVKYICSGQLDELRLNAALDVVTKFPPNKSVSDVDLKLFEESCGIGVVVTPAQIEDAVEEELNKVTISFFYLFMKKLAILPQFFSNIPLIFNMF